MDRLAEHALDLFAPLGLPVQARSMFGALGFYAGGLFFAVGDREEGRLYLKVDAGSRGAFEAAGGRPFTYQMPGKPPIEMAYLTPPDAALEDPEEMLPWARLALEAARRAAAAKGAKGAKKARGAARGAKVVKVAKATKGATPARAVKPARAPKAVKGRRKAPRER